MDKRIKAFSLALACGMVFSLLMSFARFNWACDGIRDNVLRIHILANSDSTADQLLKMEIRDSVVAAGQELFGGCETKEQAITCLKENLPLLQRAAEETIARSGADYPVRLEIKKAQFETREYESFVLPAGEYDSLCISIGEARGQNWWCIMFPTFCIGAAEAELPKDQEDIIEGKSKYRVRFKAVELLEELRYILNF